MLNKEHKLTVNDLIVEYMMYKVKNGYEPSFLTSEFITFLKQFENVMEVQGVIYDGKELFEKFLEEKKKYDWQYIINRNTMKAEIDMHMEMVYSEKDEDYLIKANYGFGDYDRSVINTYHMSLRKVTDMRASIKDYLFGQEKRKIDENIEVDEIDTLIGKHVSAYMVNSIWNAYVESKIKYNNWPTQCRDIDKYLLEMDLAEIIEVKSIKKELIELYNVLTKRIAIMHNQDKNLQISYFKNGYLARANYELLINGYEDIIGIAFGEYKNKLEIDLSNFIITDSYEVYDGNSYYDKPDVKIKTTDVESFEIKKLVKSLNQCDNIKNN